MNLRDKLKVILVDLDGVLCNGESFTEKQCQNAKPNNKIIGKINELYKVNFIVIYTARRDHLIPATLRWLRRNGVYFHAFSNNKTSADIYIDERAIKPSEL